MISKKARLLFDNVCAAAHEHELCLMECTDRKTGKKVNVLCSVSTEGGGTVLMQPLAKLFSGNPYHEVIPPGLDAPKMI